MRMCGYDEITLYESNLVYKTNVLNITKELQALVQSKLNHRRFALGFRTDFICECLVDDLSQMARLNLATSVNTKEYGYEIGYTSLFNFDIPIFEFNSKSKGEKHRIARFVANHMLKQYYQNCPFDVQTWDIVAKKLGDKGNYLKDMDMFHISDSKQPWRLKRSLKEGE